MPSESMLAAGNMLVELFNMVSDCIHVPINTEHGTILLGCVVFFETQMINALMFFFSRLLNRWKG